MKRIRVLHFTTDMNISGLQTIFEALLEKGDLERFDYRFCCLTGKGDRFSYVKEIAPTVCIHIEKKRTDRSFSWLKPKIIKDATELIKKWNIDLIHTHVFPSSVIGRTASVLAQVPCLHSEHNLYYWKTFRHHFLDHLFSYFTTDISCVSQAVYNFAIEKGRLPEHKTSVLKLGCDLDRFTIFPSKNKLRKELKIPENAIVLGMVGRAVPQKGMQDLLSILDTKAITGDQIYSIFVGDGPYLPFLKKLAKEKGVYEKCRFLGFRNDMPQIYNSMDYFVHLASREGFGIVVAEAMAMGVPQIVYDMGPLPEIVKHGETGFIVPFKDKKALSNLICSLPQSKMTYKSLKVNSIERAKKCFNIQNTVKNLEQRYYSIYNRT